MLRPENPTSRMLRYVTYALAVIAICYPLFGRLNSMPIRIWDESRLALNAEEMARSGHWMVPQYNGKPDMWNTKPPLLVWCQALLMKMFGINELSVRLPVAMVALLTCLLIIAFARTFPRGQLLGISAALVLVTLRGYMDIHRARTGDFDGVVTFFLLLQAVMLFQYTESGKTGFIYGLFLSAALAVLAKGVVGLMFGPALLIFLIFRGKLIALLKNPHTYIAALLFLLLGGGYYLLRESLNPGYLIAVQNNELGGRFLHTIEGHKGDFWLYRRQLLHDQLLYWKFVLPVGFLLGLVHPEKRMRHLSWLCAIVTVSFFLVISSAETKIHWYTMPMMPFFAIICATAITTIWHWLDTHVLQNRSQLRLLLLLTAWIAIFALPYHRIEKFTVWRQEDESDKATYAATYYLKEATDGKRDVNGQFLLSFSYDAQNDFYLRALRSKGVKIAYKTVETVAAGDEVIVHEPETMAVLNQHAVAERVLHYPGVDVLRVISVQ